MDFLPLELGRGTGPALGHHDDKLRLAEVVGRADALWPDTDWPTAWVPEGPGYIAEVVGRADDLWPDTAWPTAWVLEGPGYIRLENKC